VAARVRTHLIRALAALGILLGAQIVWGAFVAGLKAGFFANTFPKLGGAWIPATLFDYDPALRNLVANPVTVQWLHRMLGTLLIIGVAVYVWQLLKTPVGRVARRHGLILLAVVAIQYLLGVLTLINAVPVALGVTHQATAMLLFGVWVAALHHARRLRVEA
jgi:cytochrome c oxidase assembly protein subunit 15